MERRGRNMQSEIGSPWIPMDDELYKAASEGRIDILENLIQAERVPQFQQPGVAGRAQQVLPERPFSRFLRVTYSGDTILHIAAGFGHLQVARRICNAFRSLLLRRNKKSETPLHYAAHAGNHEVVDELIQAARVETQIQMLDAEGVDVLKQLLRWRNQDGETALYQAVNNKRFAVVQVLINADPHLANIPDNNNVSPLYLAAMRNSLDIATKLIESLGDVSPEAYVGPHGQTALHAAALRKEGFIQSIFDFKPELANTVDDTGSTPLHFAAADNNIESVKVLLKNDKTSAYIADSSGLFPVHVAAKLGNLEVLNQIFEHCPDSDELLDAQGRNFIHTAVEKRKVNVVRWACNNSRVMRAMNARDSEGNTPLHLAVKAKDVQIFALLIASKVYIGVMNKKGLTPLDVARAQLTTGLHDWRNSERIIIRALSAIGSSRGISRNDLFIQECNLEWNEEKMMKDSESYESMAKTISIGSVLIASASFAGAFTVFNAYKADVNLSHLPGLSLAFKAFVIMVVYAFICSITATALLIRAALTCTDPKYRGSDILICIPLVMMAIKGFTGAFAIGAYVILTPVSKGLAILICVTGIVVPAFIDPGTWPNLLVAWALLKFIGWRELRRIQRIESTKYPTAPIQITDSILWEWRLFFWDNVLYSFIVLLFLVGSLINSIMLQDIVLPLVGVLLLLALVDIYCHALRWLHLYYKGY